MNIYLLLYTLAHHYFISPYLIWLFRQGPELFISLVTLRPLCFFFFFCFWLRAPVGKSMLMWRTQDLEKNFADESSRAPIKGQWTQHRITLARCGYFYWLIIVQHAWEIHRWVRGTPKSSPLVLHNTQLWMEAGRGQVRVIFLVSPSHFVYHSNANLVPLSMRERE